MIKNKTNKAGILILVMVSISCFEAKFLMAETNEENVTDSLDAPCYVEQFIMKMSLDKENPPIEPEAQHLLPYLIYKDKFTTIIKNGYNLWTMKDCQYAEKNFKHFNYRYYYSVFKFELDGAQFVRDAIMEQAIMAYEAKYGHVQRPPINKADVPAYENLARHGDLAAMFELRRYFEYPLAEDYNPEQTAARYWLFKAIEAGDEASMLEAGYDRPYSVRSELTYQNATIVMEVACEGINKAGPEPYPACFLYNLLIGENPGQVGHLILDQDHLSGNTIRPQIMSITQIDRQVVVELTSFADKFPERKRRDYFSLEGKYLGSNSADFSPSYFWNYRTMSAFTRHEFQTIESKESKVISPTIVRTLPYVESFLFWEIDYHGESRLQALDDILPLPERPPDFGKMTNEECKRNIKKQLKYYDDEMIYYERMNKIFKLDLYGILRIANRETKNLTPLEVGYARKQSQYVKDSCQYHSPRSIYSITRSFCNYIEAFKAYENLTYRSTYLVESGSDIESAKVLQVCRYYGYFNTDLSYRENPYPCYALQIRIKSNYGYKYHYVINVIPFNETTQSKHVIQSKLQIAKADLFDGKDYFILSSLLSYRHVLFERDQVRLDIFDEEFRYIGSNIPTLSNLMVPDFKLLPDGFTKQLDQWLKSNVLQTSPPDPIDYFFLIYPECGDVIVEQRRHKNLSEKR
jgi:hypothetical protein